MKSFMKKQAISLLLIFVMLLNIIPVALINEVFATEPDTRIDVTEVEVTSTDFTAPTYGAVVNDSFNFTITKGSPAHISATMGGWEKKQGDTFVNYDETVFTEGTYRFYTQIRVDGTAGTTHKLTDTLDIKVNNVSWTYGGSSSVKPTYSYGYIYSPEYVVEKIELPLTFNNAGTYNIPVSYTNTPITSYSVVGGVAGGTKPYTFSKTSGPSWINVSSDGTISGTPTTVGTNSDLVVRVTDSENNYKEITITVGKTNIESNLRTNITEVEATSTNFTAPTYGAVVNDSFNFTITKGSPAHISATMGGWEKKQGDTFVNYDETVFTEGTYRFYTQIRVDGIAGETHKLTDTLDIKVNNVSWTYGGSSSVKPTYSYGYIYSPEYVVRSGSTPTTYAVTFDTDGGTPVPAVQNVTSGQKATRPTTNPTKTGFTFGGWYEDNTFTTEFDFENITITEATTIYAKWTSNTPTYTLTFYPNGGTGTMEPISGLTGTYTLPTSTFTPPAGKQFKGWSLTNSGAIISTVSMTKDRAVFAIWENASTATYAVTFDTDGGTPVPAVQNVTSGQKATRPTTNPTKTGFTFEGWYEDNTFTTEFDFENKTITAATTIYAKFTEKPPITHTLTIITNQNNKVEYGGIQYATGSTIQIPEGELVLLYAKAITGWEFVNASSEDVTILKNGSIGRKFNMPNKDVTIQFVFRQSIPTTYAVTFDTDGGTPVPAVQNVTSGEKATRPTTNPTKTGFTFEGWYEDNTFTTEFDFENKTITAETTIYAKFVEDTIYPNKPTSLSETSYTYDGNSHLPTVVGYDPNTMTIEGNNSQINAGTYTITVSPKQKWAEGGNSSVSFAWNINRRDITIRPADRTEAYSETPLKANAYQIESGSWAANDALFNIKYSGTQTYVGSSNSKFTSFDIKNKNTQADVSANYNVTTKSGTLTLTTATKNDITKSETFMITEVVSCTYLESLVGKTGISATITDSSVGNYTSEGHFLPIAVGTTSLIYNIPAEDIGGSSDPEYSAYTVKINITVKDTLPSYDFLEDTENQSFTEGALTSYRIVIDAEYNSFKSLKINGVEYEKDVDFVVTSGSTIITFTQQGLNKLNALGAGNYDVEVEFRGESIVGTITLANNNNNPNDTTHNNNNNDNNNNNATANTTNNNNANSNSNPTTEAPKAEEKVINNPKTGDTKIIVYSVLFVLSLVGICACIVINKRK